MDYLVFAVGIIVGMFIQTIAFAVAANVFQKKEENKVKDDWWKNGEKPPFDTYNDED
jgi:hypothetical protein